jgi:hypothetical protein
MCQPYWRGGGADGVPCPPHGASCKRVAQPEPRWGWHGQGGAQLASSASAAWPDDGRAGAVRRPQGMGLTSLLRQRTAELSGIVNGIDPAEWDPRTDPYIPRNYHEGAPTQRLTQPASACLRVHVLGWRRHTRCRAIWAIPPLLFAHLCIMIRPKLNYMVCY